MKKDAKKQLNKELEEEQTIDGKKLSEVFADVESFESVKVEKNKDTSSKNFEINFDPNADVQLKKKKSLTKRIISWVTICIMIVVGGYAGSILGDIIIGRYLTETYDPNAVETTSLVEDESTIQNWKKLPIQSLTATQVFVVAEYNLTNCTYYSVTTKGYDGEEKGSVIANVPLMGAVNQTLCGYRFRNGDVGYFDYNSSGYADVIKKTNFTFGGNEFYTYNLTDGQWVPEVKDENGNEKARTAEEYQEAVGCPADKPIDYIVSTKTVLTEQSNGMTGEYYSFTITLNPETAVANYAKKMNYMAGLGYPTFQDVELRFEVDDQLRFRNIYIKEHYEVPGLAKTDAKFKNEFSYENIEIK